MRIPETISATEAVELAVVERSGFVESRHIGAAIVLDPEGVPVKELGPTRAPVFPRSSLKPIQAATCLALGAELSGDHAAMATASHSGTVEHTRLVHEILTQAGFSEADLRCPSAWPGDSTARAARAALGHGPTPLAMNCSGKHAAMLRACRAQGWSTTDYLTPEHPLQRTIAANLQRLADEPSAAIGVDGCGAPVFAISLHGLARGIQRLTKLPSNDALTAAAERVVSAVHRAPWTIDGPGRADTVMIETLGVFAKGGAEGVQIVLAPDGHVLALKILDGSARARTVVALTLLARLGALSETAVAATLERLPTSITGGDAVVGEIRATV